MIVDNHHFSKSIGDFCALRGVHGGSPRSLPGVPWGVLGEPLGAFGWLWVSLVGVLGLSKGPLGASWAPLGVSWGRLGCFLWVYWGSLGRKGAGCSACRMVLEEVLDALRVAQKKIVAVLLS